MFLKLGLLYIYRVKTALIINVLVKNMIDRVILGNPFMCLLYPFTTDSERITTHPFGMDDLELAEELLLDNHLFNIL